jgi:hypothetical protein
MLVSSIGKLLIVKIIFQPALNHVAWVKLVHFPNFFFLAWTFIPCICSSMRLNTVDYRNIILTSFHSCLDTDLRFFIRFFFLFFSVFCTVFIFFFCYSLQEILASGHRTFVNVPLSFFSFLVVEHLSPCPSRDCSISSWRRLTTSWLEVQLVWVTLLSSKSKGMSWKRCQFHPDNLKDQ